MKVAILGATGGTGVELVKQALQQGHDVTALVRNPEKMREKVPDEKLKVETVDVTSADSLTPHFKGKDVILSVLKSVPTRERITLYTDSIKAIVSAMRSANIRRLIYTSGYHTYDDPENPPPLIIRWFVKPFLLQHYLVNLAEMETYLSEECGDLEWTVVRVPQLINGSVTELKFAEQENVPQVTGLQHGLFGWPQMVRADLARFLLSVMSTDKYKGKAMAVATVAE